MIENEYMWHKFLSKGATFNLYQEVSLAHMKVFEAEKGPFILLIVLSIVIAILALFGAYYQRFLFRQLLDPTFQTSGWVFFGVIAGSAVLRFFLFNVFFLLTLVCAEFSELYLHQCAVSLGELPHSALLSLACLY